MNETKIGEELMSDEYYDLERRTEIKASSNRLKKKFLTWRECEIVYSLQHRKVQRQLNKKLKIEGILMTMVNIRTNYAKDICRVVNEAYGSKIKVHGIYIPRSVRAEETSAEGISIYEHDRNGNVAAAYEKLTEEVLKNA